MVLVQSKPRKKSMCAAKGTVLEVTQVGAQKILSEFQALSIELFILVELGFACPDC